MNSLFPIKPIAQGTPDVESLASYIYRSAYEHGVSVGKLIKYMVLVDKNNILETRYGNVNSYVSADNLIRPNKTSREMVEVLEKITKYKFKECVLWFLGENIGTCRQDIVKGFRWCPECFREMEVMGVTPYYKLMWHLSGFEVCPDHRVPFVSECQFCGESQTKTVRSYPIGLCGNCGKSLSIRNIKLNTCEVVDRNLLSGLDIAQLFKEIYLYPDIELNMRLARNSLRHVWYCRKKELKDAGISKMLSMNSVMYMAEPYRECRSLTMQVIRRISYTLGISLFDFMSENAYRYPKQLVCIVEENRLPDFMHVQSRKKINHEVVKKQLTQLNAQSQSPVSLKEAARTLDVSVGYLEYRYPGMVKQMVKKYVAYREQLKIDKQYKARIAALQYFTHEKYQLQNKSRKQAYRVLREETGLPKFVLKDAIQSVYTSLY